MERTSWLTLYGLAFFFFFFNYYSVPVMTVCQKRLQLLLSHVPHKGQLNEQRETQSAVLSSQKQRVCYYRTGKSCEP